MLTFLKILDQKMLTNTVYDHTRLNAPDLVRSRKLSNVGIG